MQLREKQPLMDNGQKLAQKLRQKPVSAKVAETCFCQDGLNRCWQKLANTVSSTLTCLCELQTMCVGSYDHTVRVFDTRCSSSVLRIDHGSPVESVVMFPGGGLVASAGS